MTVNRAAFINRLIVVLCLFAALASPAGSLYAQPVAGKPEASQAAAAQPAQVPSSLAPYWESQ